MEAEIVTTDPLAIGRKVKEWLVGHMSSGPCVAAVLEGNEAPRKVRKLCGATLPNVALTAALTAGAHSGVVAASFAGGGGYTAASGSADLTVAPAPLTVKADDKTKILGAPNPMQRFFSVDCGHAAISGRSCGRVFDECTGVVFKHRAQATNGIAAR